MSALRMGEMLRRMGKLTALDVDEILFEQGVARRRFGDIAVAWGLCQPDDVCQAWCDQLTGDPGRLGPGQVDPAALALVPAPVARRLRIVPLRLLGGQLLVLAAGGLDSAAITELLRLTGRDVRAVPAPPARIDQALARLYPALAA
jgi:hypothetical protein